MADSDINPCGICVRIALVFINILYLLIALGIAGIGIFFLAKERNSSFLFGGTSLVVVSIVVMVIGFVILLTAILGIIGAIGNFWPVISIYSFFILLLILGQLAGATFVFINKDNVETRIDEQILIYIKNYTTSSSSNYDEATNDAIDIIQMTFKCCGLTGPTDWVLLNPKYVLTNGVPNSCACDGQESQCLTIPYSTVGVWKQGCNETVYDFAKKNLLALGGTALGISTLQIMTLFLSVGLCCCGLTQNKSRRRYVTMRDTETSEEYNNTTVQSVPAEGWQWNKTNEPFQTEYTKVV